MSDTKYKETMDILFDSTSAIREERVRELLAAEAACQAVAGQVGRPGCQPRDLGHHVRTALLRASECAAAHAAELAVADVIPVLDAVLSARQILREADHPAATMVAPDMISAIASEATTHTRGETAKVETPPRSPEIVELLAAVATDLGVGSELVMAAKLVAVEENMWEPRMAPTERKIAELVEVAKSSARQGRWLETFGAMVLADNIRPSIAGRASVVLGALFEAAITGKEVTHTSVAYEATAAPHGLYGDGVAACVKLYEAESLLAVYEGDDVPF